MAGPGASVPADFWLGVLVFFQVVLPTVMPECSHDMAASFPPSNLREKGYERMTEAKVAFII